MSDERDQDTAMTGELARANSYAAELQTLRARVEELESSRKDARDALDEMGKAFGSFACEVMARSIEGLADAAVIKQQQMSEIDALAWLGKLSAEAISYRARLRAVSEAAQKVVDTFTADGAQGYRSRNRQYAIEILQSGLRAIVEGK